MRVKKGIISAILACLLTVSIIAPMSTASATDTYSYTSDLGGDNAQIELFTEKAADFSLTVYDGISISGENANVCGESASVNKTNWLSYVGWFYEYNSKIYQLVSCSEVAHYAIGREVVSAAGTSRTYSGWDAWNLGLPSIPIYKSCYIVDGRLVVSGAVTDYELAEFSNEKIKTNLNEAPFNCQVAYLQTVYGDIYEFYNYFYQQNDSYGTMGDPRWRIEVYVEPHDIYINFGETIPVPLFKLSATVSGYTYDYSFKEIALCEISFDAQGGQCTSTAKKCIANQSYGELPTPTRTHYDFGGWYTDPDGGGTQILSSNTVTGNTTLYAKWIPVKYTVSFESNDGAAVAPITQDYGTAVAEPAAPTKTGYSFTGWYSDPELTNAVSWPYTITTGDVTFYAGWTVNRYTVSFEPNGGSEVLPVTQDYGSEAAEPAAPTKTGYSFAGWYSDSELMNAVNWPYTITSGDVTFYAGWTVNRYTVSFEPNGGSEVLPVTQDYGTEAAEPAAPTKTGYSFAGWYSNPQLTNAVSWPLLIGADDITLYAGWRIKLTSGFITAQPNYTVNFNSNNGDMLFSRIVPSGETVDTPPIPVREGYEFDGWFKDSACTIPWNFSKERVTGSITLYAKWTLSSAPITVTVYFNSNGGSETADVTLVSGDILAEPPAPTRSGYIFTGWYKEGVPWSFTESVTENMTLIAEWEEETEEEEEKEPADDPVDDARKDPPVAVSNSRNEPYNPSNNDEMPVDADVNEDTHDIKPIVDRGYNTEEKENLTENDVAVRNVSHWNGFNTSLRYYAAALLALLTLAFLALRSYLHKKMTVSIFDDAGNEICTSAISGNKVDITKAVSRMSGKLLQVCVSDCYLNNRRGSELEICYSGETVGKVQIEDNVLEIYIR